MSLAGFQAQNHPQQTGKRGARDDVDDRGTDQAFFDMVDARFRFTLDAAAAPHNAKCARYFSREDDGLSQSWASSRVWCNPPFSGIGAWVEKAWREWQGYLPGEVLTRPSIVNNRPGVIVMLLPANRVEQAWWQDYVEPYRDRPGSPLRVEFLRGRMRFDRPSAVIGPKGDRPPFGCCLLVWASA